METIKHGMNGYRIPAYMEEILTHHYCPYFVRMTIVREKDSYRFSYRPDKYRQLKPETMNVYDKLMLLRTLIAINDAAEGYLIGAENYLLEPELIYTSGKGYDRSDVRILFYPDVTGQRLNKKLLHFTERLRNAGLRDEKELLGGLSEAIDQDGINKARLYLDKNILRMECRSLGKAS